MKTSRARGSTWLAWVGFWLVIALFFTSRSVQRGGASPADARSWLIAVAWNLPSFLLWGFLSFAIEALRRRFPLDGRHRRNLYVHAAASLIVAPLHLALLSGLLGVASRIWGWTFFAWDLDLTLPVFFHLNLLLYWLIVLGGEALAYSRRVREQQLASTRLEHQLTEARLAALRMQLHPHFLFNTLNSIAELMHEDLAAAERMTLRLSGLLRTALKTASDHVVPLREEIEFLERYLEVEKVRFQDRLAVELELDPEIAESRVPALVLQPLVENAVRHGIGRLHAGGRIVVRAVRGPSQILLEVLNDAPAQDAPATSRHPGGGVGLANTAARLRQIFGSRALFEYGYLPGEPRYRARIELPARGRPRDNRRLGGERRHPCSSAPSERHCGSTRVTSWTRIRERLVSGAPKLAKWGVIWLVVAVFSASWIVTANRATRGAEHWSRALGLNFGSYAIWAALAMPLVRLSRLVPWGRRRRWTHLGVKVLLAVLFSVLHSAIFVFLLTTQVHSHSLLDAYGRALTHTLRFNFHFDLLTALLVMFADESLGWYRRFRRESLHNARLVEQLAKLRLETLRLQLQPHFLFNALSSITEMLYLDPDEAERLVLRLSSLLRTLLETTPDQLIPLRDELDFVRRYLEIEQVRWGDRLRWRIDVEPDALTAEVPCLVLQPLLDNAIVHGIGRLEKGGELVVEATVGGESLSLRIENDTAAHVTGMSVEPSTAGLQATRRRLDHFYGRNPVSLLAGPADVPNRFRVALTLPLRVPTEFVLDEAADLATEIVWTRS